MAVIALVLDSAGSHNHSVTTSRLWKSICISRGAGGAKAGWTREKHMSIRSPQPENQGKKKAPEGRDKQDPIELDTQAMNKASEFFPTNVAGQLGLGGRVAVICGTGSSGETWIGELGRSRGGGRILD